VQTIRKQNEKAKEIMEQQEDMIADYRQRMDAAVEKIQKKILQKAS
jgi:hypothetical protein